MDTREAREHRDRLAEEIAERIHIFQVRTGLRVTGIDLHELQSSRGPAELVIQIRVDLP